MVEFNARFGDPETQPLMAVLASPLGVVLKAAADGRLDQVGPLQWRDGAAVGVVVAAQGLPRDARARVTGSPASRTPRRSTAST